MRIAYLDCFSGISGDMFLGALLDAGVPFELFVNTVADLHIGAALERSRVERGGISATKFDVIVNGEKNLPREEFWAARQKTRAGNQRSKASDSHGHDGTADPSAPLRSGRDDKLQAIATTDAAAPGHAYVDGESGHPHIHEHGDHEHSHDHKDARCLSDILRIISAAPISERARQTASEIFLALGAAEAKVHNVGVDDIHFHEVGAADAIVDVVCAAVGAEALGVDGIICSPLNVGGGTVTCAHGVLPIPAPATLELLQGVPIYSGEIQKELVTPTGAAIVKVLVSSFGPRPAMTTDNIGYGAGSRNFSGHANVLRLTVGETTEAAFASVTAHGASEEIAILEANLDDLNPQLIGYIVDLALAEGALDVFTAPVQMKKNRPGTLLTILAKPAQEATMRALLFRESSTLGVRTRHEKRYVLPRSFETVPTPWGDVRIKVASLDGAVSQYAPEYEDCRRIAVEHHLPLKTVMQEAIRLYLDRQHG